jgi:flagellar hook-length control protein FliK
MLDVPIVSSSGAETRATAATITDSAPRAAPDLASVPEDGFLTALVAQSLTPWTLPPSAALALTANPLNSSGQNLPGAQAELAALGVARRAIAAITSAAPTTATPATLTATPLAGLETEGARAASALDLSNDAAPELAPSAVTATLDASMEDALNSERGSSPTDSRPASPGTPTLLHTSVTHAPVRQPDLAPNIQAYHGKPTLLPLAEPELFVERLNQHVAIMLSEHSQFARIAVNPPELGPVEVRINVVGDEANIQIAAPHAATRDALQDALPRLRAALGDSGLALGDANVFAQMPHRESPPEHGASRTAFEHDDDAEVARASMVRHIKLGLVDAFV